MMIILAWLIVDSMLLAYLKFIAFRQAQLMEVQVEQGVFILTHNVSGCCNATQQIHLRQESIECIQQVWEECLTNPQEDFYIILDDLDQEALGFKITRTDKKRIELYHATNNGTETCKMKIEEFKAFLRWYREQINE